MESSARTQFALVTAGPGRQPLNACSPKVVSVTDKFRKHGESQLSSFVLEGYKTIFCCITKEIGVTKVLYFSSICLHESIVFHRLG